MNENHLPKITKDIFVKEVKGNMVTSKDGLIQSVLGTGVISGKDENGKEHNLTFELLGKIPMLTQLQLISLIFLARK